MAMVVQDAQQSTGLVSCTFNNQHSSVWIESLQDVNKSFLLNRKKKSPYLIIEIYTLLVQFVCLKASIMWVEIINFSRALCVMGDSVTP